MNSTKYYYDYVNSTKYYYDYVNSTNMTMWTVPESVQFQYVNSDQSWAYSIEYSLCFCQDEQEYQVISV